MTRHSRWFPGKTEAKERKARKSEGMPSLPRQSPEVREALAKNPPLQFGGEGLVEGADRIMRKPEEHQALGVAIKPGAVPNGMVDVNMQQAQQGACRVTTQKIARVYLRVSTDQQDLARQNTIVDNAKAAGYYVAGVYREKASGARADRPELLRMVADLQPADVVIAEKIDRISRLPLPEAELLIQSIQAKGARLAVPGVVDLSELAQASEGVAKVVLESVQAMLLRLALQMARDDYEDRRERQVQGIELARHKGKYRGRQPDLEMHNRIVTLRKNYSIAETAKLAGCSESQVKRIWALRAHDQSPDVDR